MHTADDRQGVGQALGAEGSGPTSVRTVRTYEAVVVHGPGQVGLEVREVPQVGSEEVLIEVAYEGVCRTDLEVAAGTLGYYVSGRAHYPITPGHEFSGVVAEVGASVRDVGPGDSVVVECIQSCGRCTPCVTGNQVGCTRRKEVGVVGKDGGYAQYVVVEARFVHAIPPGVDLKRAALCEPTAVVLKGLRRLDPLLSTGEHRGRVGVVGVGPIGYLCAQVLSARGYDVTAWDHDRGRLRCVAQAGITAAADVTAMHELEGLVEATGDPHVVRDLLIHGAAGAAILLLGLPYGRDEFNFENIVAHDRVVIGSLGSGHADYEAALRLLPDLQLDPLLEHVIPLEQYEEAWYSCRHRKRLKTLLSMRI